MHRGGQVGRLVFVTATFRLWGENKKRERVGLMVCGEGEKFSCLPNVSWKILNKYTSIDMSHFLLFPYITWSSAYAWTPQNHFLFPCNKSFPLRKNTPYNKRGQNLILHQRLNLLSFCYFVLLSFKLTMCNCGKRTVAIATRTAPCQQIVVASKWRVWLLIRFRTFGEKKRDKGNQWLSCAFPFCLSLTHHFW